MWIENTVGHLSPSAEMSPVKPFNLLSHQAVCLFDRWLSCLWPVISLFALNSEHLSGEDRSCPILAFLVSEYTERHMKIPLTIGWIKNIRMRRRQRSTS